MRTPALFLGALAAAWAALASPLGPAAAELAARGLTVHEAEWQVQAFRDGPLLQLNGTVQEVHRQLTALNPNYEADFGGNATEAGDVEARGEYWADSKVTCGAPWYGYTERGYNEAVHYLSWHKGRPNMGAGPRQCWRVSCSWNTGVYICNDVSGGGGRRRRCVGALANAARRTRSPTRSAHGWLSPTALCARTSATCRSRPT